MFTLAIAHAEGEVVVLDAVRERKPPFSPEHAVQEFAGLLKAYRVYTVEGDRYGGDGRVRDFPFTGSATRSPINREANCIAISYRF